jgi:hypothetical protein
MKQNSAQGGPTMSNPLILIGKIPNLYGWLTLALLAVGTASKTLAQCNPGDHLIGEDADNYYCSAKTCAELDGQIQKDEEALRRQQKFIEDSNQELQDWTNENSKAEKEALKHASEFLVDSTIGALGEHFQAKLDRVEREFTQRAPMGETWNRKVEKVRELDARYAHLSAITDGIKLAQYPGMDVSDGWLKLKKWAHGAGEDTNVIDSTFKQFKKDPEVRKILTDSGLDFISDGLQLALKPFAQSSFDFAKFAEKYGYDAASWAASRARIMQNIALDERNMTAVCALSRQLKITVHNHNICLGKYPGPKDTSPESQQCANAP